MKTIWPEPLSSIAGSSARASSIGASRLTRSVPVIRSAVKSSIRPVPGSPALATRISTSPAAAASASAAPGSTRSAASARCPSPGSSASSASSASALRALSTTLAPRSARARAIARPRPPVAPVRSAVRPAIRIPRCKLPAGRRSTGIRAPSAKGHKMFVFHEHPTGRSSTLPPFRMTETPNPVRSEAPRERGNHVFGANPPFIGGGAGSFRASPTANPVGRRGRPVCLRTNTGSGWGWRQPRRC